MSDPSVYPWGQAADWPTFDSDTDTPAGHTVQLDGRDYTVDTADYLHRSARSLRDTVVQATQSDDLLFNSDAAWDRYAYSWHHGAGAVYHDFAPEADPFRFARNSGIDPWTPNELRLNRPIQADTDQALRANDLLFAPDLYWYVVNITDSKVWVGRFGTPGNWSDVFSGLSGTPQCLETFGYRVYVGTSTKIQYYDIIGGGFTWTDFHPSPSRDWEMLRFVAGRFFGFTSAGVMYELSSAGASTEVFSPIQGASGSFRWSCCFSLGSRVYAGGNDRVTSHLWTFEADSVGNLYRGPEAFDLPPGEIIYCATSGAGFALIGTNRGIRFVRPVGDGTLEYGPLIGVIGDDYESYTDIVIDGRWAWALGAVDPFNGDPCLVRIDLATFTSPLAPAWAYDAALRGGASLSGGGNGKRRLGVQPGVAASGFDHGAPRLLVGCGLFGATYYPVAACQERTFNSDSVTAGTFPYEEEGRLESGTVFLGTSDLKRLHSLHVVTDDMTTGHTVEAAVTDEGDRSVGDGGVDYDAEADLVARGFVLDLADAEVGAARVTVDLLAVGGADTPVMRRWKLRGFPIVPPVEEWVVPLILSRRVTQGGGTSVAQDSADLLADIRTLWLSKRAVVYREGDVAARVRVEDFEVTSPPKWAVNGTHFEMTVKVRLLTV